MSSPFVSETYFTGPSVSAHVVAPSQNAVVGREMVNVTNYTRGGGVVTNRSIDIAKLQAATGQPIKPVRVQTKGPVAPGGVRGPLQELRIYRPPVAAVKAPRLDAAKSPTLNLDPDPKGLSVSPAPLDTGALRPPSLDRPTESLSPPPLSSPSLGGTPVGGALGGGILGRGRR
jgi:hypothetical protein